MTSREPITKEDLVRRREALGLTQEQLGAELGLTRLTIVRLENGTRGIKDNRLGLALDTLEAMAKRKKKK